MIHIYLLWIHNAKCVVKSYIKRQLSCVHKTLSLGRFNFLTAASETPTSSWWTSVFHLSKVCAWEGMTVSTASGSSGPCLGEALPWGSDQGLRSHNSPGRPAPCSFHWRSVIPEDEQERKQAEPTGTWPLPNNSSQCLWSSSRQHGHALWAKLCAELLMCSVAMAFPVCLSKALALAPLTEWRNRGFRDMPELAWGHTAVRELGLLASKIRALVVPSNLSVYVSNKCGL